ncbi:tetratricopeptide repeat protein [Arcticibacter tournemirensis]|uniref:histidine kinase n=1 Tax=Arcticibacter tournemirensis TaxID=699437 RepID=A0A4Q0M553_9SPHI|nr:tetratricopeptide repeat protein [Arcticibacter tournemirensis]RXF67786.1 tetratricopeptide repeat protein [Arcticibacter tournemirensis]
MFDKTFISFLGLFFLFQIETLSFLKENPTESREYNFHKIDSLNNLAFEVKRNDIEKAMSFLYQALSLSKKYQYRKGIAENQLCEAGIYQQNGFPRKALSLYYRALEISRSIQDTFNIARANQQLGNLQADAGQLKKAEALYMKAIENYHALNRRDDIANIKNSLGLVKLNQGQLDKAQEYFEEALQESKSIKYYYGEKKARYNLGLLYLKRGEHNTAQEFFNSTLVLDISKNDKYSIALTKNKLAEIEIQKGDYTSALKLAQSAYSDAKSIHAMQVGFETIQIICALYKKAGKLNKVIEWQNELITEQKHLSDKEKNYALNFVDILKDQYGKQMKAERTALWAQKRNSYYTLILFIVCGGFVVFFVLSYFWRREYKKAAIYSKELAEKNQLIQENLTSLNELNSAISRQNLYLEESNRMKDKLLSIISHDLRQPLANTKGTLELINSADASEEETTMLLSMLESQYIQSLSLLDNLLFWIKGQMSGGATRFINVNLRFVINAVVAEAEQTAKRKNIKVINELTEDLLIAGDMEMLKVIFRNLLSNALKYTENGWIRIFATREKEISVHISDSGKGMDTNTINKIKDKNYFTTKGTNMESGSGFGLMICSDLIQKHKGALTIESEPGKGSVFMVTLPLN